MTREPFTILNRWGLRTEILSEAIGPLVGERVRAARESKGWSLRKLGLVADVSYAYISLLETGRVPKPGAAQLQKIARGLDVSVEWLLAGLETGEDAGANQVREDARDHLPADP